MKVKSKSEVTQLCLTLSDLMDCSLPGSSIHGIFQARVLEWGTIVFSHMCSQKKKKKKNPRWCFWFSGALEDNSVLVFCFLLVESESEVAQLCPILCDPVDCSPPGSSVHGILQARILEWVAISFSRGSSRPRDQTQVSCIAGRCFNL